MKFPELLYVPTQYDIRVGTSPRRFISRAAGAFATLGGGLNVTELVDPNEIVVLTGFAIGVQSQGASAETLRRMSLVAVLPGGGVGVELFEQRSNVAAGFGQEAHAAGELEYVLMPDERIRLETSKSAAIDAWDQVAAVWGYILPRANLQTG